MICVKSSLDVDDSAGWVLTVVAAAAPQTVARHLGERRRVGCRRWRDVAQTLRRRVRQRRVERPLRRPSLVHEEHGDAPPSTDEPE